MISDLGQGKAPGVACPFCGAALQADHINYAAGVAQCQGCTSLIAINELLSLKGRSVGTPPLGAWLKRAKGRLVLGAWLYSFKELLWPAIFVIVCGAASCYGWVDKAPLQKIYLTIVGGTAGLGVCIAIFLGKTELVLSPAGGVIFTGALGLGYRQRFSWAEVKYLQKISSYTEGVPLELIGQTSFLFGSKLKEESYYYIMNALDVLLLQKKWQPEAFYSFLAGHDLPGGHAQPPCYNTPAREDMRLSKLTCPFCERDIQDSRRLVAHAGKDALPPCVDIAGNRAYCQACGEVAPLSELLKLQDVVGMGAPPPGAWYDRRTGKVVLGGYVGTSDLALIISLVGACGAFIWYKYQGDWNLLVRILYPGIGGPLLLFLLGMVLFGKVEVTLTPTGGAIFNGIGWIGQTKRFRWEGVRAIRKQSMQIMIRTRGVRHKEGYEQLVLDGYLPIGFAGNLPPGRRHYLYCTLYRLLLRKSWNAHRFYAWLRGEAHDFMAGQRPLASPPTILLPDLPS